MTTATIDHTATMLNMNHWWQNAQCKGQPIKNYDLKGQVNKPAIARELCAGCPVKPQCAYDALQHGDNGLVRGGVWIPDETSLAIRHERQAVVNALYEVVLEGV